MGKERKCILCEMVCTSKQEMDEHMRSMLHHRELENLKGRDCGHECKVCRVTVVSLTDYASHISSNLHKQNVEASERKNAGNDRDEDYFDRALVDLIEKRKELIRKEEAAAAAKRAKEEEKQRKHEFEQRLKEAKDRFRKSCALRQPPRGLSGPNRQEAWNGNSFSGGRQLEAQAASRHWNHSGQGKSATWHAQEPPNLHNWESEGQWVGGSQQFGGDKRWEQGAFSGNQRSRLPWLSNQGSSNGVYGRNNIPQCPPVNRPLSLFGPINGFPPPPSLFARPTGQVQNQGNGQEGQQGDGHQNKEGPNAERDRNNSMGPKTFGSNPKLDKTCRWSPYPPTKLFDSAPQKDTHPSPSEKYSKAPKSQKRETAPATNPSNRQSQLEQKPRQSSSAMDSSEGKRKSNKGTKNRDRSSSSGRSSSAQRDGQKTSLPGPSKERADRPSEPREKKHSVTSTLKSQLSRASSQESEQSKSSSKHSGSSSKSSHSVVLQSVQDQQLAEILKKAKETMLDKRGSVDISTDSRMEMVLHITEEQQRECPESQVGANKENKGRQDRAKAPTPELIRPSPCGEEKMKSGMPPSDSSQSLQSVQVSTSTVESSAPVASTREEEEEEEEEEGGRKREEEGRGLVATDEAMQAVEAGQGSESDVSLRSSEAQTTSGSTAPDLNKLGLPLVLKRDLTKHISSKSKAVSHEPNLNSARRVRNLSGSRRVEAEKESGLKPTVRQLISSSGARRSVNWEQVYQEVCRKKQEQGKGMPRFGIEMVSHDPEELSQEEDNIPLLEGFQWESLLDPFAPRKRCLSESSIAPDCSSSGHSLFSQTPGERLTRESLCRPGRRSSELQESSPPDPVSVHGNRDNQQQQDEERRLGQCGPKAQKRPDGTSKGTEKTLQNYDSLLGDSSSGTELYDATGTGKKRRAARDIPNPEIPSLGRKNKRRKIKSKKERFQVDQLLAVSLREEELSRSLQTVDNSLIQARAALQATYMEVQRLMVVKQQMSDEMSSLRNRRIDLLQGMQGDLEGAAKIRVKEEPMDSITAEPDVASLLSPLADDASVPCPGHAYQVPQCASPPSSTFPFIPVIIKQEPLSPVRIHTEPDPEEETVHYAHSTTPELPVLPVSTSHTDTVTFQLSPERAPELLNVNGEPTQEGFRAPAECEDGSLDVGQSVDRPLQVECKLTQTDSKPLAALSLASRRSSGTGSVADPSASPSYEPSSVPPVLSVPLSPSELRSGKRVRKLKKRRVLKKAQGAEKAENSDTELEGEAVRPVRRLRPRRRASGGLHVSTSTTPTAVEDEEGDQVRERNREEVEEEEEASGLLSPATKPEQGDSDSSQEMVELPQAAPAAEMVNVDSSDPEDSSMEVTMACQDAQTAIHTPDTAPALAPTPDTSTEPEPQNLACNEVTSTSEMDTSPVVKLFESDVQMPLALPNMSKTLPEDVVDVSSDPGEDDMPTEGAFEGHQEMVNAMQIHNGLLYTCSGDRTVKVFNLVSRKCVAVFEGHSSKVNCLLVSATPCLQRRLYSGSSDQTIRCYSLKTRECVAQFSLPDRVLCLHSRWHVLYAGLANGTVVTFNLKTNKQLDVFDCHGPRAVSCLASAQEGARKILLVGSYDHTISVRDAKSGLLLRTLEGHTKTVLCLKVVNDLVFSGASDHAVHAHNIHTGELVRIYKGHSHAVTVVDILGKVMVTACLDKLVRVYELQSHDRLQVYGGHKDMVLCMAIHKSMIYTGCYDGSVQAVKLNLMQNYRCWWHGCSMIFGVMEHLQQHLINDHTNPNFQTLKCRWKDCDEFFSARNGSKQGVPKHMQKHAEEENKLEP